MSLGCISAFDSWNQSTLCLSEFAGYYADMMCEFCCTSLDYCNALKSFDTIAADCARLSSATNQLYQAFPCVYYYCIVVVWLVASGGAVH